MQSVRAIIIIISDFAERTCPARRAEPESCVVFCHICVARQLRTGTGRHDDPEEIEHDKIRQEIRESHRFESFAGERFNNFVKWCVPLLIDGWAWC